MRRFLLSFVVLTLPFASVAQSEQLLNLIGQGQGVFQQVQGVKASRAAAMEKCTFTYSDAYGVLVLAQEYNMELFLKNENKGTANIVDSEYSNNLNTTSDIGKQEYDLKDCQKTCDDELAKKNSYLGTTDEQKKDDCMKKSKCSSFYISSLYANAGSGDLLIGGKINMDKFAANDLPYIKRVANYISYNWSSVLTDSERTLLAKANANCAFENTKMWGNIISQMIKGSGLEGADGIADTLGGTLNNVSSPSDLISSFSGQIQQNPEMLGNIMDKFSK